MFGRFTAEDDFATMTEKIDSFLKEKHAYRFFAIERITDENLIGLVLLQKAEHADCCYVGFYVEPLSRRRGFGMEAMNQLVDYAFRTEKSVDRIEAGTSSLNIPSQKALEKVGFRRRVERKTMHENGKRKDTILYVITGISSVVHRGLHCGASSPFCINAFKKGSPQKLTSRTREVTISPTLYSV